MNDCKLVTSTKGDVRRWTWGGQLRDVGFGRERDVRGVGWVAGGQLHDTGPGRDKCERHGEHQATVDPRRHMGATLCVGFHGSIKVQLGITCRLHQSSAQIRFKNSYSAVKKQVKSLSDLLYLLKHLFLPC